MGEKLLLVPRSGPDQEPRDASLATWFVHPGPPGEWKVSCRWVDADGREYGWWSWAEQRNTW